MTSSQRLLAVLLVLSTASSFADDMRPQTYATAKALADRDEKALSGPQLQLLIAAQGNIGGKAVSECMTVIRPKRPVSFGLVMEIDKAGSVRRTWPDGESAISKCFESKMVGKALNSPPHAPFYTVFEIDFQ